ncbi:MAG: transcription-repair coupling factor [Bacteroidia bacterium]|nr:MAG: transcription-repair coupling factor [Bacteroidia bacterium]
MSRTEKFPALFTSSKGFHDLEAFTGESDRPDVAFVSGLAGSSAAVIAAASIQKTKKSFLFILSNKETAAYFFNDLEILMGEKDKSYEDRHVFFFPSSYKKPLHSKEEDKAGVLLRAEVLNRLSAETGQTIIVTYPEAYAEKVVAGDIIKKNILTLRNGENLSVEFLMDVLIEYGFEHVDFVVEPGQFSVRGGIVDVYSFSNDFPFRIEIMGDRTESLRTFDTETQLSVAIQEKISILPDIRAMQQEANLTECILEALPGNTVIWSEDTAFCGEIIRNGMEEDHFNTTDYISYVEFLSGLQKHRLVEFRRKLIAKDSDTRITFSHAPQPNFNKHFDLLISNLRQNTRQGIKNIILYDSPKQIRRIESIFETIAEDDKDDIDFRHEGMLLTLHEGFIDHDNEIACYTDHQIFGRYHRYRIRDKFAGKQLMTLKALRNLKPGDYVTHIDHGIGIYSGLEKIEVMGRIQEAIRLVYKNNDILYVSIHSLHRVSKYTGKEGTAPTLHRLGSNAWSRLKNKTKNKVKDIAKDLISLYAKRKAQQGFAFSPDTYLQHELEASFIFEDTPDQEKSTAAVKSDMESPTPMDRLICGDVGFGKTEVAIRAAFKAVNDSKQVAVLVPTTILALQHYYTFTDRLKDFPCTVDYISRFRSTKERKKALDGAREGQVDILIGTHRLLSKDIAFKDLGLLIIDEEQKFGVASKEKLKQLRINVDTLTLTATPIPRTLQFSLLGARDLSFLNTPPPNRYPIITEVHVFNEELIREAIEFEISRGGQVYFVHNRVQNIQDVAAIVQRVCPQVSVAVGHGQLEGTRLEKIMVDFIHGEYDVLVSTTIIESGLDIPNANTIIINNAHHFGLSDLHQMRGRVGRTNKKAFCYLLSPPMSALTDEARKRLKSIEEFSELGSGFNIAMRDLDIRGAGNLLGAEQSGFISEVGLETYHKILDEAIAELKEQEFRDVFKDESAETRLQSIRCHLETDLGLMIPTDYVWNIEERLNLYKELDSITDTAKLDTFAQKMIDRFGPLPESVKGLLQAVRLRKYAQEAGFEKIILKAGKLIGYLPGSEMTDYYGGATFGNMLDYAKRHPKRTRIREVNDQLAMNIEQVTGIDEALDIISSFLSPR